MRNSRGTGAYPATTGLSAVMVSPRDNNILILGDLRAAPDSATYNANL